MIEAGGTLAGVTVTGALIGGAGSDNGLIKSTGNMGPIMIGGSVQGGADNFAGAIDSHNDLTSLTIGGSLTGGAGLSSGYVVSNGNMGPATIKGALQGGAGALSGAIFSNFGSISTVTIGGSVIGGSADFSGEISAATSLGAVNVVGDLVGSSVSGNVLLTQSGCIEAGSGNLASIHIGGSIIAGANNGGQLNNSGAIQTSAAIGPITVVGSLIGNSTNPVVISAVGQTVLATGATVDNAIASLTVGGRVDYADILAGYNPQLMGVNGQAGIGPVTVGQDWIASNLIAGASAGNGVTTITPTTNFGTAGSVDLPPAFPSNTSLLAEIASITIGSQVLGTPSSVNSNDAFGFVAQHVVSFSEGGTALKVKAGRSNDYLAVGATNDVTLLEVT